MLYKQLSQEAGIPQSPASSGHRAAFLQVGPGLVKPGKEGLCNRWEWCGVGPRGNPLWHVILNKDIYKDLKVILK